MRILLVEPAKPPITLGGEDVSLFEPLALEYVAAGVAGSHDVRILDQRIDPDLDRVLEDFDPEVVGFTAYTVHVDVVRRLCEHVKGRNSKILTVVGGHHASVLPEDFLSPSIDAVVMGEGVLSFRTIVSRFEKGDDLAGIPGTAVRNGSALMKTEDRTPMNMDALPFPMRSLTARYRKHYYSEWMKPLASIRTSKGCPYRCNFCALWRLTGGRYLKRSPECIVKELQGIEEENVFFADDESMVDAPRMKKLADLIQEAGIRKRYFLYGRSDTIAKHPDLLEAWRDVGLERIFVGLEFFRDKDLEYINKGSSIDDNAKAVKILQDLGIDIYASFIVRPEFTHEDFDALHDYCRRLGLDFASFAVLTPLPGTGFYRDMQERLITRDYALYDFVHTVLPTVLPLPQFYGELARLYREAIPKGKQLSILAKYRWREIPPLLSKSRRILKQVEGAHLHYH